MCLNVPGSQSFKRINGLPNICAGLKSQRKHSNASLQSPTRLVVQSTRINWKCAEECIKKSSLYRNAFVGATRLKVPHLDLDRFIGQMYENSVALYGIILGVVGLRLSASFGTGWTLIGACVFTTCLGYSVFIQQAMIRATKKQGPLNVLNLSSILLQAQALALETVSFRVGQKTRGINSGSLFVSSFFEPSPVYLLLNCWAMYAIGQCVICGNLGNGVLLLVSAASMLAGRWLQHALWMHFESLNAQNMDKSLIGTEADPSEASLKKPTASIFGLLFTPIGTWGIGPIFNGPVWFAALLLPLVEYPASPIVMAPLWTSLGAPVLLLVEDVYSILNKKRRNEKYAMSMGPGLQIGSVLVGLGGAILLRSVDHLCF